MQRGPGRLSPFMIPMLITQHGERHRLDGVRAAGAELCHRLRLRDQRPRDRRSVADDPRRRCGCLSRRRQRGGDRAAGHRRLCGDEGAFHAQRRADRAPRGRGIATATASSWAKARACSSWRSSSTRRSAARASTREIAGYGLSGGRLPHERAAAESRAGAALHAAWRMARAGVEPRRQWTTSTRTAPARRSATSAKCARCKAVFGDARATTGCSSPPRNR